MGEVAPGGRERELPLDLDADPEPLGQSRQDRRAADAHLFEAAASDQRAELAGCERIAVQVRAEEALFPSADVDEPVVHHGNEDPAGLQHPAKLPNSLCAKLGGRDVLEHLHAQNPVRGRVLDGKRAHVTDLHAQPVALLLRHALAGDFEARGGVIDAEDSGSAVEKRLEESPGTATGVDDRVGAIEAQRGERDRVLDLAQIRVLGPVIVIDPCLSIAQGALTGDDRLGVGRFHRSHVRAASSPARIVLCGLATDAAPPGLVDALASRGATVVGSWAEGAREYLFADSAEGRLFARSSHDPADVAVLEHEAVVRAVVGAEGPLRAPRVLERGFDWLLEKAIEAEPFGGPDHVALVSAAAVRLQELDLPARPLGNGSPRALKALRRFRMLISPVLLADVRRARRILAESELPVVTTHGDFHPGNVLVSGNGVWVVDWELSGRGPAGSDLLHFWSTIETPEERQRLFDAAVELAGADHKRELLRLRYAVLVRAIAAKLAALMPFDRDPEGARRLLALLPEVRREAGR